MITTTTPLEDLQVTFHIPAALRKLEQPTHEALARFIHEDAKDPTTRTVAVTSMVLTLWQIAGTRLTRRVPSLIRISPAAADAGDSVGGMIDSLFEMTHAQKPGVRTEGAYSCGSVEGAAKAMRCAVFRMTHLDLSHDHDGRTRSAEEEYFNAAKQTGFGTGCHRPHSEAWHPEFGLLCDNTGYLVSRIETDKDREAFISDAFHRTEMLKRPTGIGPGLRETTRSIALSGSLAPANWNAALADAVVGLGLPIFPLLHPPAESFQWTRQQPFTLMVEKAHAMRGVRVEPQAHFPDMPWLDQHLARLRERLRHLPPDYGYAVETAVRELMQVCDRAMTWMHPDSQSSRVKQIIIVTELWSHTLQGIVLSVMGLGWHALGIETGVPLKNARAALHLLRTNGPTSPREILRKVKAIHAKSRDKMLGCLRDEGLVRFSGNTVEAVPFEEYVAKLHDTLRLPPPPDCWGEAKECFGKQ